MTAKCGGGTSAAKPGFDQVVIGAGLITAGLGVIAPWLLPFGVLLDAFVYDVGTECPTDPPPMPTATDLAITNVIPGGILNPGFNTWRTAVQNLLLNWAWEQYCQCTSGAVVPAPYPPAGPTVISPSPVTVGPCLSGRWTGQVTVRNTGTNTIGDWNSLMSMFPALSGITVTTAGPPFTAIPVPNGATSFSWQGIGTEFSRISDQPFPVNTVSIDQWDASGVYLGGLDAVQARGLSNLPSYQGTRNLFAGAKYFHIAAVNDRTLGPVPSDLDFAMQFHCDPGASNSQPCCPPDPSVLTAIQQLYQLVQSIYLGLPHQLNSYADGVAHTGLSRNGTITLAAQVLGIRVNITTDPASLGLDVGDPNYLFDRGFIVPVVNAAPIRAESRLVYNPQMFLLPALTEQIGYSLHPGVVVTITELLRGP